ncbi:unnamed protein product, partial [Ectocarpus sp. 4 AP-2014]
VPEADTDRGDTRSLEISESYGSCGSTATSSQAPSHRSLEISESCGSCGSVTTTSQGRYQRSWGTSLS